MMNQQTRDRFHQMTAPNGRDINSILSKIDCDTIEAALRCYVSLTHHEACQAALYRRSDKEIEMRNEDYEKAVVAYQKFTGQSALASR